MLIKVFLPADRARWSQTFCPSSGQVVAPIGGFRGTAASRPTTLSSVWSILVGFYCLFLLRHTERCKKPQTFVSVWWCCAEMITGPQCTKTLAQRESTGGRWGGKVAHVCMPECKYQRKAHVLALGNLGERSMECLTVVASVLPYELGSYSLFRFFLCKRLQRLWSHGAGRHCCTCCLDTVDFLLGLCCTSCSC